MKKDIITTGLGVLLVAGVTVLTVASSSSLITALNKEADKRFVATLSDIDRVHASNGGIRENNVLAKEISFETSDDQNGETDSVHKTYTVHSNSADNPLDTASANSSDNSINVSIEDGEAVKYPYYIGTEFVVVDPDGNMVYMVKKGDTLSEVSGLVGYSVDELAKYNCINNVNLIYADESLRIPADNDVVESVKSYIQNKEAGGSASTEDAVACDDEISSHQN